MAKSAHLAQTSVDRVWAGHSACLALSLTKTEKQFVGSSKGLVVLSLPVPPTRAFIVDMCLLKGPPVTMLPRRYETAMHILHQKKSVRLLSMEAIETSNLLSGPHGHVLRHGCRARATFAIVSGSGYVRKGMRVILRDSSVRAVGVAKELITSSYSPK